MYAFHSRHVFEGNQNGKRQLADALGKHARGCGHSPLLGRELSLTSQWRKLAHGSTSDFHNRCGPAVRTDICWFHRRHRSPPRLHSRSIATITAIKAAMKTVDDLRSFTRSSHAPSPRSNYISWTAQLQTNERAVELSWVYITADGQSTSLSWYRAPLWGPWPDFILPIFSDNCFNVLPVGRPLWREDGSVV
jgi:hypothetical protein